MSKKEFEPKYQVFTNNVNLVKVGCTYAGKMVYGVAKCAPEDEFNYDYGYRLAKARCDHAICTAKMKRSQDKIDFYRHYADMFAKMVEDEVSYEQRLHKNWIESIEELYAASYQR